ncbi:hypothetical protein Zmor_001112 [Zophobas morio]|uniref:Uncharacterized protein n=1 Tax=Zophobas morio TaxID=2755281 RepID=A0AA38IYM8_9CUCU|nr:hypothetical protein Zmor_001112 [Zophobas morio]
MIPKRLNETSCLERNEKNHSHEYCLLVLALPSFRISTKTLPENLFSLRKTSQPSLLFHSPSYYLFVYVLAFPSSRIFTKMLQENLSLSLQSRYFRIFFHAGWEYQCIGLAVQRCR